MPLIQVKVIEGVFSSDQKKEIVKKLTDAMVSVEGENMRKFTWVLVEEVKDGDWGIGGKSVTASDIRVMSAGQKSGG
jgi:4-oxalocrotonate tautomerase